MNNSFSWTVVFANSVDKGIIKKLDLKESNMNYMTLRKVKATSLQKGVYCDRSHQHSEHCL